MYSERFKEMLGYPGDFDTSAWSSFFDLMHPEDHPRVREVFRGLMREKRKPGLQPPGEPLEYRLLKHGGGHVWVKAASLAQVDAAGQIRRFITSFQDVTAYRATADERSSRTSRLLPMPAGPRTTVVAPPPSNACRSSASSSGRLASK